MWALPFHVFEPYVTEIDHSYKHALYLVHNVNSYFHIFSAKDEHSDGMKILFFSSFDV